MEDRRRAESDLAIRIAKRGARGWIQRGVFGGTHDFQAVAGRALSGFGSGLLGTRCRESLYLLTDHLISRRRAPISRKDD